MLPCKIYSTGRPKNDIKALDVKNRPPHWRESSFGGTSFGLFCRSYLNAQTPSAFSSQRIIPCSDHQIRTPCGGDACKRRRAKANSPIYSIARAIALPSRRRKTKSYTAVVAVAKVQNANFLLPTSPTRACSRA
uniref:Secreted protein n=1 Tax=Steinernema glaseri TaxID=37863 RepID=A0A1I7Y8U1_9BILA